MKINRRFFSKGLLASTAVLGFSGCASNVATGRLSLIGSTMNQDIENSKKNHEQILKENGGEYENIKLQSYLSSLGNKIAENVEIHEYPYKFFVLDSPRVNAFVTAGGYVYLYRGLVSLLNSEAELASIIGHELGHANARHISERTGQAIWASVGRAVLDVAIGQNQNPIYDEGLNFLTNTLLSSFSREQEYEADRLGIKYMTLAGYDPEGAISAFEALVGDSKLESAMLGLPIGQADSFNIMSTHPRTKDRIKKAMAESFKYQPDNAVKNEESFFTAIDGMAFGSKIAGGYAKGRSYFHKTSRVMYTVPEGFRFLYGASSEEGVIARNYESKAYIAFSEGKMGKTDNLEDYLTKELGDKINFDSVEFFEEGPIKYALGSYKTKEGNVKALVFAGDGRQTFDFKIVGLGSYGDGAEEWEQEIVKSFKRLTFAEAEAIKPNHIKIIRKVNGKNISDFSESLPFAEYNNSYFRVLNGMDVIDAMFDPRNMNLADEEIDKEYLKVIV